MSNRNLATPFPETRYWKLSIAPIRESKSGVTLDLMVLMKQGSKQLNLENE